MLNTRAKATAWLLATFLTGTLLGASLTYYVVSNQAAMNPPERQRQWPSAERMASRLNQDAGLQLSREQLSRLIEVFAENKKAHQEATVQEQETRERIRKAARQKIRGILSPEQRIKFDQFLEKRGHRSSDRRSERRWTSPHPKGRGEDNRKDPSSP